jgi:hypothetical protein
MAKQPTNKQQCGRVECITKRLQNCEMIACLALSLFAAAVPRRAAHCAVDSLLVVAVPTGLYGSVNHHGRRGGVQLLRALDKGGSFFGDKSTGRAAQQDADHQRLQQERLNDDFHDGGIVMFDCR